MLNKMDGTNDETSRNRPIDENKVVMIFKSSLVKHAASNLRLPANFVGVHCARQDFKKPTPVSNSMDAKGRTDAEVAAHRKASNDVKFCVLDESGNERRMTKAEKKAKKFQIAQQKKEAKKEANAKKKRKLEEIMVEDGTNLENDSSETGGHRRATEKENDDLLMGPTESSVTFYHQLPLNSTTMEREMAEFRGKRGSTPPVILSPCMAFQFISNDTNSTATGSSVREKTCREGEESAILTYDHSLSQEWANRLKELCVLPAEAVRQKEDLRPLAYRLQPEPWQRLRPTLEENRLETSNRDITERDQKFSPTTSIDFMADNNPKSRDWIPLTCRPRLMSLSPASQERSQIQHDDILSIVFEYIHRETPFHVSCGAKFGSDFLVYDGPREERHAFAGLRVLSRFTNSMTTSPSHTPTLDSTKASSKEGAVSEETLSSVHTVELPLPTAYSLTGFVRCLNTAGKLALLATVDQVYEDEIGNNVVQESSSGKKKKYRVAFVDVALEKVLDVHQQKNRRRPGKKKLQKRRDVTQTLSKR